MSYSWLQVALLIAAWSILAFIIYPCVVVRKFKKELERGELREKVKLYVREILKHLVNDDEEFRNFLNMFVDYAGDVAKQKIEMYFLNLRSQMSKKLKKAEEEMSEMSLSSLVDDPLLLVFLNAVPERFQPFIPLLLQKFQKPARPPAEGGGGGGVVKVE